MPYFKLHLQSGRKWCKTHIYSHVDIELKPQWVPGILCAAITTMIIFTAHAVSKGSCGKLTQRSLPEQPYDSLLIVYSLYVLFSEFVCVNCLGFSIWSIFEYDDSNLNSKLKMCLYTFILVWIHFFFFQLQIV